jgi:hypothetical protein
MSFRSSLIPCAFRLGGFRIEVRFDDTLLAEDNGIGQSSYLAQEIVLDPSAGPQQLVEQAFFYELVRWIFFMMGEHELRNNERVRDVFAQFLYQALKTAEPLRSSSTSEESASRNWTDEANLEKVPASNSLCRDKLLERIRWWGEPYGPEDFWEGDYSEVIYDEQGKDLPCDCDDDADCDENEEVDYDLGCNDYDPPDYDMELAQAEREEEEESRREMEEEMACWSDYADSVARSEDEGWFYDDDD